MNIEKVNAEMDAGISNLAASIHAFYNRALMEQITAPTLFDTPGEKIFDHRLGYWVHRTHSIKSWPEFEVVPGAFRVRAQWRRAQQAYTLGRERASDAAYVLRHGMPQCD